MKIKYLISLILSVGASLALVVSSLARFAAFIFINEDHPETCDFNFGSGTAIWNNGGVCVGI